MLNEESLATLVPADPIDPTPVLIAAPRYVLTGRVVDEEDAPLAGVSVELELTQELFRELGLRRPIERERRVVRSDARAAS